MSLGGVQAEVGARRGALDATGSAWRRIALGFVIAVFLCLAVPSLFSWPSIAGDGKITAFDYLAFAAGGELAREAPADLYDPVAQQRVEHALARTEGRCCPSLVPFINPPHVAVAYGAFGAFGASGFGSGYVVVAIVNLALLGALGLVVHHLARPLSARLRGLLVVGTAASGPAASAMAHGGPSALAALGLTLVLLGERRRNGLLTCFGLLAVSTKPHFLVLPLLWLALRGRWRAIGAFAFGGLATVLATVPLIGLGPWLRYPQAVLHYSGTNSAADVDPRNWWNVVGSMTAAGVDHRAAWLGHAGWLVFGAGMVILAGLVRRAAGSVTAQAPLAAALLALGILAVPHANPHDALVIGPALVLAVVDGAARPHRRAHKLFVGLALLWPPLSTVATFARLTSAFAHVPVAVITLVALVAGGSVLIGRRADAESVSLASSG